MRDKIILKNTAKYKALKLAKGINIEHLRKIKRFGYSEGISTLGYGDNWFITKHGNGLFKAYKYYEYNVTKDLRILSELLYRDIASQVGINTAEYRPANINDDIGLVSIDVSQNGEKVVELCDLFAKNVVVDNFETFIRAINVLGMDYTFNKEQICFDLFKLMVLDALTFQEDRHNSNIHFLIGRDNSVKLSPIIDNEFSFGVKTLNKFRTNEFKDFNTSEFLEVHSSYMLFPVYEKTTFLPSDIRYKSNIKDLIQMCYNRKEYENFVVDCLNKIDIEKAIKNVETMGYKISADYKKYLKDIINLSKQIFVSTIKETRQMHPNCFEQKNEKEIW